MAVSRVDFPLWRFTKELIWRIISVMKNQTQAWVVIDKIQRMKTWVEESKVEEAMEWVE